MEHGGGGIDLSLIFGLRLERRIQDCASVAGDANQQGEQEEEDMGA